MNNHSVNIHLCTVDSIVGSGEVGSCLVVGTESVTKHPRMVVVYRIPFGRTFVGVSASIFANCDVDVEATQW